MVSQIKDRKLRICLVNPKLEGPYPPLGIGYIASYLRKYGKYNYEFKIVDGNCCRDVLVEVINFKPDLVGFTSLSPQIKDAIDLSCRLRTLKTDMRQIIGGMHVSALPEETLAKGNFDLGVLGEGERTFLELVDLLAEGRFCAEALKKIKGICFKENSNFFRTAQQEEIVELDSIPPPARELFNMQYYLSYNLLIRGLTGNRVTTVMGSRGCPFNCTFCSSKIVFKYPRQFSAKYIIDEIKDLVNRYKVKAIFFTDDTFTLNKEKARQLCNLMIGEGIHRQIRWEVQGRADTIGWDDLELLKLMRQASCQQIDYGFESGSDRIIGFLKKNKVTVEDNQRAIRVTKKAGLKVLGTFMLGTVGESEAELQQTRDFIVKNINDIDYFQTFITTPYPGTELYSECLNKGIVDKDYFLQVKKDMATPEKPVCYCCGAKDKYIRSLFRFLNKLAIGKIKMTDKLIWLALNIVRKPYKVIDAIRLFY